jgi:HK97 gp10 family phage protein
MARAVTVKIDGLKDLEKALEQFKPATSKAIARRALMKAAEPIVAEARRLAPIDKGHLARSINASTNLGHDVGKAAFAAALSGGASKGEAVQALRNARRGDTSRAAVTVVIGPGRHPQAIMQEFGTLNHPPQAFMRPAWDGNHDKALDSIKDSMANEIMKAAKRAARKAAKGAS